MGGTKGGLETGGFGKASGQCGCWDAEVGIRDKKRLNRQGAKSAKSTKNIKTADDRKNAKKL